MEAILRNWADGDRSSMRGRLLGLWARRRGLGSGMLLFFFFPSLA